jgi:hypothetical protein
MKEEFKAAGWRDFAQRYENTFGWFITELGERKLVQLTDVTDAVLRFVSKEGMTYFAHADKGNVFEFIPVTKGVYQYGEDVVYVCRKPARQWKRGLCHDNTLIQNLSYGGFIEVDFPIIESIYKDNDNVVLEKFREDMSPFNVALDNIFSINGNRLMLYGNNIGMFNREREEVILTSPIFKQEVKDLFRSLSMEVVVE